MATHQDINKAKRNGSGNHQYSSSTTVTVPQLIDLLVQSSKSTRHASIRRGANALLEKMAKSHWVITAGPHRGGKGSRDRLPDYTNHISVRFTRSRKSFHLRLDAKGHLFMITGPGMDENIRPWIAPGSVEKKKEK